MASTPFELGDLNNVVGSAMGIIAQRGLDSSQNFQSLLDRKFLQVATEVDPLQGAAVKEIQRGQSVFPGAVTMPNRATPST